MSCRVSIITVCYNSADSIAKTIESVKKQTYSDIEYIVIDGESKDDTLDIVKSFGDSVDHILSEPDKGIYDAMNKGLKLSSGDWVLFLNSGDTFYRPSAISDFVSFQKRYGQAHIYLGKIRTLIKNNPGKIVCPKETVSAWYTPPHQAMFLPRNVAATESFDTSYSILADRELYIRLVRTYHLSPVLLPSIVANYDMDGVSSNGKNAFKIYREGKRIQREYGGGGKVYQYIKATIKYLLSIILSPSLLTKLRYS